MQKNVCPHCSRHCPLDAPRCKKGREYRKKIDAGGMEKPRYASLSRDEKIARCLRKLGKKCKQCEPGTIPEILTPLDDSQRDLLLELLEKIRQK